MKASEDKTYPGAIVAGLDAPWGQSIAANDPNNLFSSGYREVFSRDLYEAWTALYTDGDLATARDTVRYLLLHSQQANGSEPRNSLLDGTKAADAFNDQLDESSYPILMALQSGLAGDNTLWPHIKLAADFLVSHGPSFGVERWEEQTGYSPSDHRRRDRGPRCCRDHREPARRRGIRPGVDGDRRPVPALDHGVGRHDDGQPVDVAVLHPPVEDGRPERRDQLQRRQRRTDARPAGGRRQRLPRVRAAGHPARDRPGCRELPGGDGCDDREADRQRARLAAL